MKIEDYRNYLEKKNDINKKHIPFYVNWVRSFLKYCKGKIDFGNPTKQIDLFLIQTGKRYEQWQVNQAKKQSGFIAILQAKQNKAT